MGIKVENRPNLERDEHSQAIINTDRSAYNLYMQRRVKAEKQQDDIRSCVKEIKIALDAVKEFNKPILVGLHFRKNGLLPLSLIHI